MAALFFKEASLTVMSVYCKCINNMVEFLTLKCYLRISYILLDNTQAFVYRYTSNNNYSNCMHI